MAEKKKDVTESTEIVVVEVTEELLREKLYEVRGVKVMLDSDLAEIYGYTTKALNQQVKNNNDRFDSEFTFKLTQEEWKDLRSKNLTSSWGGSRHLPNVFTEQGVYMLMTVLKGELAAKQSKDLVKTFKKMKDYILGNQGLIGQRDIMQITMQSAENKAEISRLRMDLGSVEKQMSDVMDQLSDVDGLVGYSPIAMAKNAIGLAIATEEYGSKFFANGAAPSGVLEHPGTIKDPSKVRESWQATFGGSGNANKIAVLEEGMKYTPISISPEQAQFLETRKFQIDEIARIFRVPPHMIGDLEKSSFNNIEQQSLEFAKYTLDPWVSRWEQAMVRALLAPDEKKKYFFKFNVDGLLRGDYQSRMNGYATARQNGWMSGWISSGHFPFIRCCRRSSSSGDLMSRRRWRVKKLRAS